MRGNDASAHSVPSLPGMRHSHVIKFCANCEWGPGHVCKGRHLCTVGQRRGRCCKTKCAIFSKQFSLFHQALPKKHHQGRLTWFNKINKSANLAIAAIPAIPKSGAHIARKEHILMKTGR